MRGRKRKGKNVTFKTVPSKLQSLCAGLSLVLMLLKGKRWGARAREVRGSKTAEGG